LPRDLAEHQVPEYSENCVFGVSAASIAKKLEGITISYEPNSLLGGTIEFFG
jgi:hypothetical protein